MNPCEQAFYMAQSIPLKIVISLKIIACLFGIFALRFVYKRKLTLWLIHPNAKFLFSAYVYASGVFLFFFSIIYILDIIRLSQYHTNPCDYMISIKVPLVIRTPCAVIYYLQILLILSLSIERVIASLWLESYEKIKSCKNAVIWVSILAIFTVIYVFLMLVYNTNFDTKVTAFVLRTKYNATRFQYFLWSQIVPEVLTLLIFHLVLWINTGKKYKENGLSKKYQIRENYQVCQMLLPIMYIDLLFFFFVTFGMTIVVTVFPNWDIASFAIANELIIVPIQIYPWILALFLKWRLHRKQLQDNQVSRIHGANHFLTIDEIVQNTTRQQNERNLFHSFCFTL